MNYGTEQGLPSAYVADLLETGDHQYWVATAGGLVRFDPSGIQQRPGAAPTQSATRPAAGQPPMFASVLPMDRDPAGGTVNVLVEDLQGSGQQCGAPFALHAGRDRDPCLTKAHGCRWTSPTTVSDSTHERHTMVKACRASVVVPNASAG